MIFKRKYLKKNLNKIYEEKEWNVSKIRNMSEIFKSTPEIKSSPKKKEEMKKEYKFKMTKTTYGQPYINIDKLIIGDNFIEKIDSELSYQIIDTQIIFTKKDKERVLPIIYDRNFFEFIRELDRIKRKKIIY